MIFFFSISLVQDNLVSVPVTKEDIPSQQPQYVAFREIQKMNRVWWAMLLVYGLTALMWWGFIQQIILGIPWGNKPAPDWMMWIIWLLFGIGFPVFFNLMRLIVEIYDDHVDIRFAPIHSRQIPFINIVAVKARNYSAIKDYGGWGIRSLSSSRRMAYNIKGNEGVELTLRDGRLVLIGSQQADELAEAIINNMGTMGLKPGS